MPTAAVAGSACAALLLLLTAGAAAARPACGLGTGVPASGAPIPVGAIVGETGPDDFSAGADAARAFFACVNANGGINGRPIDYRVEDDQWSPEVASHVAAKLVEDEGVVAMAGSGSFVETTVNARLYEQANVAVVAAACAVRECFESRNVASTNQGPVPSNILSAQWAIANLGTRKVACVALNIPSNGVWACDATVAWLQSRGLEGVPVLFDPASADLTSVLLEAVATGADTILVSLPANLAVAFLKAAEEQDLRDRFHWIAPTPLYKEGVPEALGAYWSGKVFLNIELAPLDSDGPDARRWRAVMDAYARPEDPRDTFSQAGFVAANILVDTLLAMDAARVGDRASVTAALKGVRNFRTDLLCAPWYFGDADAHQPNHAGMQMVVTSKGFEKVADCFEVEGGAFEALRTREQAEGLTGN